MRNLFIMWLRGFAPLVILAGFGIVQATIIPEIEPDASGWTVLYAASVMLVGLPLALGWTSRWLWRDDK